MSSDMRCQPSSTSIESIYQDAEKSLGIKIILSGTTNEKIAQLRQAIGSVVEEEHNKQDAVDLMLRIKFLAGDKLEQADLERVLRIKLLAGDKLEQADLERVYRPTLQKFIDVYEQYGFIHQQVTGNLQEFSLKDNKIPMSGDLDKDIQTVRAIIHKIDIVSRECLPESMDWFFQIHFFAKGDTKKLLDAVEKAKKEGKFVQPARFTLCYDSESALEESMKVLDKMNESKASKK